MLLEWRYEKRKSCTFYVRCRHWQAYVKSPEEVVMKPGLLSSRNQLRIHLDCNVSSTFALKHRIEFVKYNVPSERISERGFVIYQDVICKWRSAKAIFRLMVFDSDDHQARIYAYEHDLPGTFSVPSFSKRGTRYYFLFNRKIGRNYFLSIKLARTVFDNQWETGSGATYRPGNKHTEIKALFRITI
jgi:hypothetical protein